MSEKRSGCAGRLAPSLLPDWRKMDPRRYRLYVNLSASQVRKRLKGYGLGVVKVESVDRGRSLVIHTATGEHLRRLEALLADVIAPPAAPEAPEHEPGSSGGGSGIHEA